MRLRGGGEEGSRGGGGGVTCTMMNGALVG